MPVVSNSSPLIALEQIGQLEMLKSLWREIVIPDQVAAETGASVHARSWIRKHSLSLPLLPATQRPTLGPGEREAICLAIEIRAAAILLDDDPARKVAIQLGLPVIGTAGVLILAKERHLIAAVRPWLDALIENRFFLAPAVYELILKRVEEM
jgi:predicted nucleic acid-binding protein